MADEDNGNSSSRLDRIERIVEALATNHEDMQGELRMLLKSQVLMSESIGELRDQQKQTGANLGALILIVDEVIRGKKPGGLA